MASLIPLRLPGNKTSDRPSGFVAAAGHPVQGPRKYFTCRFIPWDIRIVGVAAVLILCRCIPRTKDGAPASDAAIARDRSCRIGVTAIRLMPKPISGRRKCWRQFVSGTHCCSTISITSDARAEQPGDPA
jgi:hypothetical protein